MSNQRAARPISDELRRLAIEYMEQQGITRYRLAQLAGVKLQTLYTWLGTPDSHGAGETLDRLAAFLGVGIGPVFDGIAEKTEKTSSRKHRPNNDL